MKILLIGLGRWGEKHLRVLGELGVELWVSDVSEERRGFAVKAGVAAERAVADFRVALPHVDAVDLVTPADTHLALASECLTSGRDCFIEKPVTLTGAEGRALADVVRRTGRILQVGHIFRFHPVATALRERIQNGSVGRVRYCTGRFTGFKRPRTDVGVTQTDGIHYFDLFAYLLGQAPTAVTATLRDYLGRGMDDLSFTTVEYGEVPAFIETGYFAPGTYRDCVIVGDKATLAGDFGTAVVAIGTDIEASILTTSALVDLGVRRIVAKAVTEPHGKILERVGASKVIFPERDMGVRVGHSLAGSIIDYIQLDPGFALVETVAPAELVGSSLGAAQVRQRYGITVVCIKPRGGTFTYATPDTVVSEGDILVVAGETDRAEVFGELQ